VFVLGWGFRRVIRLRRSYVTAVFVSMEFSDEDKILTKSLTSGRFDYDHCVKAKGRHFEYLL